MVELGCDGDEGKRAGNLREKSSGNATGGMAITLIVCLFIMLHLLLCLRYAAGDW